MIVKCRRSKTIKDEHETLIIPFCENELISDDNFVVLQDFYTTPCDKHLLNEHLYVFHNLTQGKDYDVYAILLYDNKIKYLISDDQNMPVFYDESLFDVLQPEILLEWELLSFNTCDRRYTILTHSSLITCYEDFRDLMSQNANQIKKFLEYKEHVESYF